MINHPPVYILSPHFDDAAYGLTVTISRLLGKYVPVTLINCFTITKWTALPIENKDVKSVSLLRREEDKDYNKIFNNAINIVNLDLLDAPLRNGYIFQSSSFSPDEWQLVEELKSKLEELVDGILFCPLGIGDHIDHAISRAAVAQVYKSKKVVFYEDLPYTQRITEEQVIEHVGKLEEAIEQKLSNLIIPTQASGIDKESCIRVYKSQLNEDICSEIMARLKVLAGERVWAEESVLEELKETLLI